MNLVFIHYKIFKKINSLSYLDYSCLIIYLFFHEIIFLNNNVTLKNLFEGLIKLVDQFLFKFWYIFEKIFEKLSNFGIILVIYII